MRIWPENRVLRPRKQNFLRARYARLEHVDKGCDRSDESIPVCTRCPLCAHTALCVHSGARGTAAATPSTHDLHADRRPGDRATPKRHRLGYDRAADSRDAIGRHVRSAPSVPPRRGRGLHSRELLTWASQRPSCPSTSAGTRPSGQLIAGSRI